MRRDCKQSHQGVKMELLLSLLLWLGVIQANSQYTSQWIADTTSANAAAINAAMQDSTLCSQVLQASQSTIPTIKVIDPDIR